jgi:hypothetical protein
VGNQETPHNTEGLPLFSRGPAFGEGAIMIYVFRISLGSPGGLGSLLWYEGHLIESDF